MSPPQFHNLGGRQKSSSPKLCTKFPLLACKQKTNDPLDWQAHSPAAYSQSLGLDAEPKLHYATTAASTTDTRTLAKKVKLTTSKTISRFPKHIRYVAKHIFIFTGKYETCLLMKLNFAVNVIVMHTQRCYRCVTEADISGREADIFRGALIIGR